MIYEYFWHLKFKCRSRELWCRGYYVDAAGKNKNKMKELYQEAIG